MTLYSRQGSRNRNNSSPFLLVFCFANIKWDKVPSARVFHSVDFHTLAQQTWSPARCYRVWTGERAPIQPRMPSSWSRQSLGIGPKPGTFLGLKDIAVIWKREHYQSPCWRASVIIIFISIKGVLWQGIVKFNLVWIRIKQGYIFYFCPGLNLSWIIQSLSILSFHAS